MSLRWLPTYFRSFNRLCARPKVVSICVSFPGLAELREHPECESAAVVIIGPTGSGWDATLAGTEATLNVECQERLAAITNRLRQQFDLGE